MLCTRLLSRVGRFSWGVGGCRTVPIFRQFKSAPAFQKVVGLHTQSTWFSTAQEDAPSESHTETPEYVDAMARVMSSVDHTKGVMDCLRVDLGGNAKVTSMNKHELLTTLKLPPRDMRTIEDASSASNPSILVRSTSIIVNMYPVKAIIQAQSVLLFTYSHPDVVSMLPYMQERLKQNKGGDEPYEFEALEVIIRSIVAGHEKRLQNIEPAVQRLVPLLSFSPKAYIEYLDEWLPMKRNLGNIESNIRNARIALDDLVASKDDLCNMYLNLKIYGKKETNPEQVEMLLETYVTVLEEMETRTQSWQKRISDTEQNLSILLDANRNEIMKLNLILTMSTFAAALATFVTGMYGMNLMNNNEQKEGMFKKVGFGAALLGGTSFATLYKIAKKRIRVL